MQEGLALHARQPAALLVIAGRGPIGSAEIVRASKRVIADETDLFVSDVLEPSIEDEGIRRCTERPAAD